MDKKSQIIEITPVDACQLIRKEPKSLFIDVRSYMEFLFIGHPVGVLHIPWIDEPDWTINPGFVVDVRKLILGGLSHGDSNPHNVPVILICRSGQRSKEAGNLLIQEGFFNVFNITGGFEGELDDNHQRSTKDGWRFDGLPWEQC